MLQPYSKMGSIDFSPQNSMTNMHIYKYSQPLFSTWLKLLAAVTTSSHFEYDAANLVHTFIDSFFFGEPLKLNQVGPGGSILLPFTDNGGHCDLL